jgi:uncharacterized phiE125 gp8 family phage protein
MSTLLVTPASADPVSVAEAKAQSVVQYTTDDAIFTALIAAATQLYQDSTGRQLVSATYRQTLGGWWGSTDYAAQYPRPLSTQWVKLTPSPVSSVTSIQYYDITGTQQTWASTNYIVDNGCEPARIYLAPGVTFPNLQPFRADAVQINYVAGYGIASAVPEIDKAAIKLLVANWYENREGAVVGDTVAELPFAVKTIINSRKMLHLY